jgi:putative flippase GtrA
MNLFKIPHLVKQFIKFSVVGIFNTLISLGIYYLLISIGINYLLANGVGFIAGIINSYYWNNRYVFQKEENNNLKPFIKSFVSYSLTFLLSSSLLYFMVHFLFISTKIAPIITLFITVPVNFVLNKFWAFK